MCRPVSVSPTINLLECISYSIRYDFHYADCHDTELQFMYVLEFSFFILEKKQKQDCHNWNILENDPSSYRICPKLSMLKKDYMTKNWKSECLHPVAGWREENQIDLVFPPSGTLPRKWPQFQDGGWGLPANTGPQESGRNPTLASSCTRLFPSTREPDGLRRGEALLEGF